MISAEDIKKNISNNYIKTKVIFKRWMGVNSLGRWMAYEYLQTGKYHDGIL
jgi:hypothetical protein